MKILYLIDTSTNNGGAPISTCILADNMVKEGYEVCIAMPKAQIANKNPEIRYIQIERFCDNFPYVFHHPFKAIRLALELKKIVEEFHPDIVHAQMPRGARAIGLLQRLNLLKGSPTLIFTERELVRDLKKIHQFLYTELIGKAYKKIVCLSPHAAKYWEKLGVCQDVRVIPNTGGAYFDEYVEQDRQAALSTYSVEENKLNVLFVGRMTWEKRWWLVKEIVERLANEENICFRMVLSYKDDSTKRQAKEFIASLGNQKNVQFFENVNRKQISDLYYASDLHVITSCMESFCRTAIEAMSRKTAVISTEAGAVRDTIGFEEYMIEDSADAISEKIKMYMEDHEQLQLNQKNMYQRYQNVYTIYSNTNSHKIMYESDLSKKNGESVEK